MDTTAGALVGTAGRRVLLALVFAVGGIVLVVVSGRLVALGRLTRALLATVVLAVTANLLSSKVGIATVALAVDTHADGLADEIGSAIARGDGDAVGNVALALLSKLGLHGLLLLLLGLLGPAKRSADSRCVWRWDNRTGSEGRPCTSCGRT